MNPRSLLMTGWFVQLILPSQAAAPSPCDAKAALGKVQMQYGMAESMLAPPFELIKIVDIAETSLGAPPESANQYATSTTYVVQSRYCQGEATLSNGTKEQVFWRIDQAKDGNSEYERIDHCSARHDTFGDNCTNIRAPVSN